MNESDITLTLEQAAAMAPCSTSKLRKAAARGEIPSRKIGRRVVFPLVKFRAWLESQERTTCHCTNGRTPQTGGSRLAKMLDNQRELLTHQAATPKTVRATR